MLGIVALLLVFLPCLSFPCLPCHPSSSPALLSVVCMLIPVHGWEYRRYVVASIEHAKGISLAKKEFDYTTLKTNNISNFSAWHNRATLIPKLLPPPIAETFHKERK